VKREHIGFPDFQKEVRHQIGPLLDSATAFLEIGGGMLSKPFSGQLASVVHEIARSVSNSMESVLVLVSNGCADDAFRIARTMFESAVTIHYLESHPELLQDYTDFLWVKRKRFHYYLLKFDPSQAEQVDSQQIEQMNVEYERVSPLFTDRKGRVRNSWCRANLRAMAEEVGADSMYGGLYEFTSSFTHTDVLGLVSGVGGSDKSPGVPSLLNIPLALKMGVLNYAMTLTAVNQVAGLMFDDRLNEAFSQLKQASVVATVP
jgi:hypothetical protein